MGDVADILGLKPKREEGQTTEIPGLTQSKVKKGPKVKAHRPAGMSREVLNLLGDDGIAPMTQPARLQTGLKEKRAGAAVRWYSTLVALYDNCSINDAFIRVWAPFKNVARQDGEEFYHWVKAGLENQIYPYAKYNTSIEAIRYTDEEYDGYLQDENWTRSETDHLMHLCSKYDLRWPVIVDRYTPTPPRTVEEMQQRYYGVVAKLRAVRTGISEDQLKMEQHATFDFAYERSRRQQQEILFRRNKEEEQEEEKLREELKVVDASIKKLKKMIKQASAAPKADAKTVHVPEQPQPGKPCLQSSRIHLSEQAPALSKTLLKKLQLLLRALDVPDEPLASRAVCDMMDKLRKDAVGLLSLHNTISKKEKEITTLRQQLKMLPEAIAVPTNALITREPEPAPPELISPAQPTVPASAMTSSSSIQKRKVVTAAEVEPHKGKRLKK